jgi:hypothetical protein
MVAIRGDKTPSLQDALGPDAADVIFVDMTELGHNPARIIPGWRRYLEEHCADGRPVRGIGEPIWAGRRPTEILEAQLHEALLNVAVDPDTPLWLRCPYDVAALSQDVVTEAACSHPILVEADDYAGSRTYGGMQHVEDLFGADLTEPAGPVAGMPLPAGSTQIATFVGTHAAEVGLDAERTWALSLAVRETTAAAVPGCLLQIWTEPGALVCEVDDPEPVEDPMAGRVRPRGAEPDPRGLWLANQMCDLVQVRSTLKGSAVRIVTWL